MTRSPHGPRIGNPLRPAPRNETEIWPESLRFWWLIASFWAVGLLAAGAAAWLMLVEKW